MGDNNEMYITQEERDPERLEGILRHSSRRQDAPVLLVQLPNATPQPLNSEFRPSQRRATVVNTTATPQINLEEKIDPFEWYFRKNNPDLRTSLVQEGTVDELTSRRKSRIGGDQMEQMVLMLSNQKLDRFPVTLNLQEYEKENIETNKAKKTRLQGVMKEDYHQSAAEPGSATQRTTSNYDDEIEFGNGNDEGFNGNEKIVESDGESLHGFEVNGGQSTPVLDTIINSLVFDKEITVMRAEPSFEDRKSPFKNAEKNALASFNQETETIVMPAEYSFTDQKSPFKKDKDEIKPRPSSRVRVLIMLDEWDEDDRLEDESRRKRHAKGDGRRGRHQSPSTREPISDKNKRNDKSRRGMQSNEDDDVDRYTSGGRSQRGRNPDSRDSDWTDRNKDKRGRQPGDQDGGKRKYGYRTRSEGPEEGFDDSDPSRRGIRPGDRDYNKRKYGDGTISEGPDEEFDDGDPSKRGIRPGDRDYNKRKYGDGTRSEGPGEEFDDGDPSKRGIRPGDRDYNKRKYGDGTRSEGPGEEFDDGDPSKRGIRPGDRDYNKRKNGDGTRSKGPGEGFDDDRKGKKGREGDDNRGKDRPGGDTDGTKYRLVTMPKAATTLNSRRRYHLQVTDHDMKEPWFNSCFNISKENNVDFNYEGPVKITPYYIGDKLF